MLAFPHDWLQNHSNICVGVFVKITSCGHHLRFLRVAASSNHRFQPSPLPPLKRGVGRQANQDHATLDSYLSKENEMGMR